MEVNIIQNGFSDMLCYHKRWTGWPSAELMIRASKDTVIMHTAWEKIKIISNTLHVHSMYKEFLQMMIQRKANK